MDGISEIIDRIRRESILAKDEVTTKDLVDRISGLVARIQDKLAKGESLVDPIMDFLLRIGPRGELPDRDLYEYLAKIQSGLADNLNKEMLLVINRGRLFVGSEDGIDISSCELIICNDAYLAVVKGASLIFRPDEKIIVFPFGKKFVACLNARDVIEKGETDIAIEILDNQQLVETLPQIYFGNEIAAFFAKHKLFGKEDLKEMQATLFGGRD